MAKKPQLKQKKMQKKAAPVEKPQIDARAIWNELDPDKKQVLYKIREIYRHYKLPKRLCEKPLYLYSTDHLELFLSRLQKGEPRWLFNIAGINEEDFKPMNSLVSALPKALAKIKKCKPIRQLTLFCMLLILLSGCATPKPQKTTEEIRELWRQCEINATGTAEWTPSLNGVGIAKDRGLFSYEQAPQRTWALFRANQIAKGACRK